MIFLSNEPAMGFVTIRLPGGEISYTLTTLLGEILNQLEADYGPRDSGYTLLGIEFGGDEPHIRYPTKCKQIAIRLTDAARLAPEQALFQLAHEAVHLLAPTGKDALVVEEGIATLFSHRMSAAYGSSFRNNEPAYACAEQTVLEWLQIHPGGVQAVRAIEPNFFAWKPSIIGIASPNTPEKLALALCAPFSNLKHKSLDV